MEPGELTAADRRPFVAELDRLKVSVELYGMRVCRYPRLAADERIETGPDVQIVLEEAGVGLRASEELTPGDLVLSRQANSKRVRPFAVGGWLDPSSALMRSNAIPFN